MKANDSANAGRRRARPRYRSVLWASAAATAIAVIAGGCQAMMEGARAGLIEGLGGPEQQNPYANGNAPSTSGSGEGSLQPVGSVAIAGCDGIEVVSYIRGAPHSGSGLRLYSVALKNGGGAAKTIEVLVKPQGEGNDTAAIRRLRISARQTKSLELSRAAEAPKTVRVTSCL